MHRSSRIVVLSAAVMVLGVSACLAPAQTSTPGDTYFSLAVTENSHNHAGAKLLYLDFQQAPFSPVDHAKGVVLSAEVPFGAITLDGHAYEWDPANLTFVSGLVQSNYPLSEYVDATPTLLAVASAWDEDYVYFLVQWEDAGHDASVRSSKWIFGDQGAGQTGWNQQVHKGATLGAPNGGAVNAIGHELAGVESEDRVFFMFPMVDNENNFSASGAGCAMYCHANLSSDDPYQNYTGDGVVAMHTNLPSDIADTWHWKATRTEPSGVADDTHIHYALGSGNGRSSDAGGAAYSSNDLASLAPTWMHFTGLGYLGNVLLDTQAVPYAGTPIPGNEIPRYRSVTPSGSRADVQTAAFFDSGTATWTVEFRRLRTTGHPDDRDFDAAGAPPPTRNLITAGNALWGSYVYSQHCVQCHGPSGLGVAASGLWQFPRVQRTSGSLVLEAAQTVPLMQHLTSLLSEQEFEDVATWHTRTGHRRALRDFLRGPLHRLDRGPAPVGLRLRDRPLGRPTAQSGTARHRRERQDLGSAHPPPGPDAARRAGLPGPRLVGTGAAVHHGRVRTGPCPPLPRHESDSGRAEASRPVARARARESRGSDHLGRPARDDPTLTTRNAAE